jgi:hypothetical protein
LNPAKPLRDVVELVDRKPPGHGVHEQRGVVFRRQGSLARAVFLLVLVTMRLLAVFTTAHKALGVIHVSGHGAQESDQLTALLRSREAQGERDEPPGQTARRELQTGD